MSKLRVWWVPQVGVSQAFYVPVKSPEEGKRVMDMLAAYDAFQLQSRIKPDYVNTGGLQMWDEKEQEWYDWYIETDEDYYDDLDEYCEQCKNVEDINEFKTEIFKQVDWNKINEMTR